MSTPTTDFRLPAGAEARQPPERRGLARDAVRLLLARPEGISHHRFRDVPGQLAPGDLLVVNTSATVPAAVVAAREDGTRLVVHVSTSLGRHGPWVIEPRRPDGGGPERTLRAGESLRLPGGLRLRLLEPYPDLEAARTRLWRAETDPGVAWLGYLARHGRPIGYRYLAGSYPIGDYQTVYARQPGSAEMPSAGRPFTAPLLVALMARGVTVAPVVLHAGVSSQEAGEPPLPERFEVPEATARLVSSTRRAGGRVVAVGTTVVRALESAVDAEGQVRAARGWTETVIGPRHPVRAVNALITGLHPPRASHLLMLEALAGPDLVAAAYRQALEHHYLWHEFGDSTLFLP